MIEKGTRVRYLVMYNDGAGFGYGHIERRPEYGTVTSVRNGKARIRAEKLTPRLTYVIRKVTDITEVPVDENKPLTYEYLASLAIAPRSDHDDVDAGEVHGYDGAYANSPLGPDIGLHIHQPSDGWDETEPARPVHVIMSRNKIAEVYPYGVVNHLHSSYGDDWRNLGAEFSWGLTREKIELMEKLLAASPEITRAEATDKEGYR